MKSQFCNEPRVRQQLEPHQPVFERKQLNDDRHNLAFVLLGLKTLADLENRLEQYGNSQLKSSEPLTFLVSKRIIITIECHSVRMIQTNRNG